MTVASRERLNWRMRFLNRPFATSAADFFVFALGLCTSFSVTFIGDFPIAEIILTPLVLVLVALRGRRANRPALKIILVLMFLWLMGQVVSDVYRGTAPFDWMRGDASIIFFAIDFVAFAILMGGNDQRKLLFIAGVALSSMLKAKLIPDPAVATFPWKFGYAWGTILCTLLLSSFLYSRRRYLIAGLCVLGLILVNLLLNFRSPVLDLLVMIALVFPVIPEHISRLTILPRAGSTMRVVVLAALAMGAGALSNTAIHVVTKAGLLSEDAEAKNEEQSRAGNLLLGGRPEFVVGLRAALDSPLIGHGSWATDYKYLEMLADMQEETGVNFNIDPVEDQSGGMIPGHSAIITAWVWAGILGLVFWVYVFVLLLRGIVRISLDRPPVAPLFTWMMVNALWDILFSPFAYARRLTVAVILVIAIDLLEPMAKNVPAMVKSRSSGWRRKPLRGTVPVPRWDGSPNSAARD